MLLSFHKFPSPWSRTPAVSPSPAWLLPKFANPQIIAETIENKKNSAESTQNRSIRWISHPLKDGSFVRKEQVSAFLGLLTVACRSRN
jgi:hypothetical protein